MERVSGVGGAFVPAQDPSQLGRWYADQLGVEFVARADGLVLFAEEPAAARERTDVGGGAWLVRFHVSDLDAMVAQLRAAGATVDIDPAGEPGGRVACVRDPEHNVIQLVEPAVSDRVWSADPAAVRVLDDDEQAPQLERRPGWRRWAPGLALLLAGVLAVAFIASRQQNTADRSTPAPRLATSAPGTEAAEGDVSVTELGEPLLGVTGGWELIAHGSGTVSRIELAEGRVTTTELPGSHGSGPVSLLAGPDWVLMRPWNNGPGYLIPDGEPARPLRGVSGGGAMFAGPGPNQVWVEYLDEENGVTELSLQSVTGEAVGPELFAPVAGPLRSDRAGYVLAPMIGGSYVLRPRGMRRVTTGTVDAVSTNHFLVTECDNRAHCSQIVITRATGQRRTRRAELVSPAPGPPKALAPDGSIAVEVQGGGMWVDNLTTGSGRTREVFVRPGDTGPGVVFSPDSEWLFGLDYDGDILAIDTGTFTTRELGIQLPAASQLTIRPAG